ncbi:hypothetical protein SSTU70S_05174 [Stutzerimonas stutzeri]
MLAVNGAYRLNKNFKFSTGIDNLLDKNYSEHLNLPAVRASPITGSTRLLGSTSRGAPTGRAST